MDRLSIRRKYIVEEPDTAEEPDSCDKPQCQKLAVTVMHTKKPSVEEDLLARLGAVNDIVASNSNWQNPKKFLVEIERLYKEHNADKLVNNPNHMCVQQNGACACALLNVRVYKKSADFLDFVDDNDRYHLCLVDYCRHITKHVCGGDDAHKGHVMTRRYSRCPHSVNYSSADTYVFDQLYVCRQTGNVHACGMFCTAKFTDTKSGGLHVCPITGVVLGAILHDWRMDANTQTMQMLEYEAVRGDDQGQEDERIDVDKHALAIMESAEIGKHAPPDDRAVFAYYRSRIHAMFVSQERQRNEVSLLLRALKILKDNLLLTFSQNRTNVYLKAACVLAQFYPDCRYIKTFAMSPEVALIIKTEMASVNAFFNANTNDANGGKVAKSPKSRSDAIARDLTSSMFSTLNKKIAKRDGFADKASVMQKEDSRHIASAAYRRRIDELMHLRDEHLVDPRAVVCEDCHGNIDQQLDDLCRTVLRVYERLSAASHLELPALATAFIPLLYMTAEGYSVNIESAARAFTESRITVIVVPKVAISALLPAIASLREYIALGASCMKIKNIHQCQNSLKAVFDAIARQGNAHKVEW